jgi:hypothetical protein
MSSPRHYIAFIHPTSNDSLCGALGRVRMIRHACIHVLQSQGPDLRRKSIRTIRSRCARMNVVDIVMWPLALEWVLVIALFDE